MNSIVNENIQTFAEMVIEAVKLNIKNGESNGLLGSRVKHIVAIFMSEDEKKIKEFLRRSRAYAD